MSRFDFSFAGPQDDAQLRLRMAQDWMEGDLAVSFRREPSYFAGCALQGEDARVAKCTDRDSGRIVALGTRAKVTVFINGARRRIGYLADLRIASPYRRGTLLARMYRLLRRLHHTEPLPFYYTIVFDGNAAALSTLLGARAGLPIYSPLGRILTPAVHLDFPRRPIDVPGIRLERGGPACREQLVAFLQRNMARRQFAPVYEMQDLIGGRLQGLRCDDFYLALREGRIIGSLAAWDQADIRQTHIERYSARLAAMRPLYNIASVLTPLKPLPAPGARIPYLYFSCIAVEGDDLPVFRSLLRFVYNDRRLGPWHYAIVGLHESDPLAPALDEYRRIPAAGRLFVVHYPEQDDPLPGLDARIPYVEMALA